MTKFPYYIEGKTSKNLTNKIGDNAFLGVVWHRERESLYFRKFDFLDL